MPEQSRTEQLRRRVQLNPASVAFAALAEEYRRAGRYDDAIETCRVGLGRHPAYLTPRVTMGRALLALDRWNEARAELERVLKAAPDHLAARRALDELEAREMRAASAPSPNRPAHLPADRRPSAGHPALPALEALLAAIRRVRADAVRAARPVSR
jgi:tetratricopeptide (TPR) repeat protein